MSPLATARVLIALAVRNLVLHRFKTLIIGVILFFGAFVFVAGTSLIDSIERSMSKSIVSSLAGHLQVHAKDAKDELALFGGLVMGVEDVGTISDFAKVKEAMLAVPNVAAVVPMGIDQCSVTTGNELDRAIQALRDAVRAADQVAVQKSVDRLRTMAENLEIELDNRSAVDADKTELAERKAAVQEIQTTEFWDALHREPEKGLQFLDTKIAPLSGGGTMIYLRYVGTDLDRFRENFDRFQVVQGEMVPSGRKGILLNQMVYERQFKHIVARELDALHRAVVRDGKTIAGDSALEARAKQMVASYSSVLFQLSPEDAAALEVALPQRFPGLSGTLAEQLKVVLTVDDLTIVDRHAAFYELIAPKIRLYEFAIGDTLTLRTYTRSGSINSANVKIYGTYHFKGIEQSELAGGHNLLDLVTFRELYGQMTEAQKAELQDIRNTIEAVEISREDAEAALFGGTAALESEAKAPPEGEDVLAKLQAGVVSTANAGDAAEATFTQDELERGLALNAAVILRDDTKLEETRAAVEVVASGLGLQVVDWRAASGLIGQFIVVVRGVLIVSIIIIILVALVIINNSMVMAMHDRISEIGTMRAIGAQRRFVMSVFLGESVVLGVAAGALGVAAGAATILWLGSAGIPAVDEVTSFLFAGPRFFPSLDVANAVLSLVLIVVIGVVSTMYPAWLATRVQPVVAMRGKGE